LRFNAACYTTYSKKLLMRYLQLSVIEYVKKC
jgi:hypothetical protein